MQTLKKTPKYRHCSPSSTVLLRTTRPEVLDPLLFCPCFRRCCLRRCCLCPVAAVAAVALPPPPPSLPQLPPLSSSSSVAFHRRLHPSPSHVVDCCLFVSNQSSYPAPSSLLPPPTRLANVVNCRTNNDRRRLSSSSPAVFGFPPSFFGRPSIIVRMTSLCRGTTATRRHRHQRFVVFIIIVGPRCRCR
jgi:hypothetical protein